MPAPKPKKPAQVYDLKVARTERAAALSDEQARVEAAMRADLARSGLAPEDFPPVARPRAILAADARAAGNPYALDCFMIPYIGVDGLASHTPRFRNLNPDAGVPRYSQARETGAQLYLAPVMNPAARPVAEVLANLEIPLYGVEGEKKAATLAKLGLAAFAVGGKDSFYENKSTSELLRTLQPWCPGRTIILVPDGEARHKPNVRSSFEKLATRLEQYGASVRIALITTRNAMDQAAPDSWLVERGLSVTSTPAELENLALKFDQELRANELAQEQPHAWRVIDARYSVIESPAAIWDHDAWELRSIKDVELITEPLLLPNPDKKGADVSAFKLWRRSSKRSTYRRTTYAPFVESPDSTILNRWRGWPYGPPARGNVQPMLDWYEAYYTNPAQRYKVLCYIAHHLRTGHPVEFMTVEYSPDGGTGKGATAHFRAGVYGLENAAAISAAEAFDVNNRAVVGKALWHIDEWPENTKGAKINIDASDIKRAVTRRTATVNLKYIPEHTIETSLAIYVTTNTIHNMPAESGDRRLHFVDVNLEPLTPASSLFKVYTAFIYWAFKRIPGDKTRVDWNVPDPVAMRAAQHYFLHEHDLSKFDPLEKPEFSPLRQEAVDANSRPTRRFVTDLADNLDDYVPAGVEILSKSHVLLLYLEHSGADVTSVRDPEALHALDSWLGREMARRFVKLGQFTVGRLASGGPDRVSLYAVREGAKWRKMLTNPVFNKLIKDAALESDTLFKNGRTRSKIAPPLTVRRASPKTPPPPKKGSKK